VEGVKAWDELRATNGKDMSPLWTVFRWLRFPSSSNLPHPTAPNSSCLDPNPSFYSYFLIGLSRSSCQMGSSSTSASMHNSDRLFRKRTSIATSNCREIGLVVMMKVYTHGQTFVRSHNRSRRHNQKLCLGFHPSESAWMGP
jgi:hypothetical protein